MLDVLTADLSSKFLFDARNATSSCFFVQIVTVCEKRADIWQYTAMLSKYTRDLECFDIRKTLERRAGAMVLHVDLEVCSYHAP